jgi:hypothetical protein
MTVTVNISTSSGLDLRWSTLYNLFANSPIQVGGSGAEFTTIDSGTFNGQDADVKFIFQGSGFTYSGAFPDVQLTGGTITGITMQTEAGVTLATFSGFSISAETFMSAMNTYTDGHAPPPSGDGNPDSSGLDGSSGPCNTMQPEAAATIHLEGATWPTPLSAGLVTTSPSAAGS